ncbi:Nucleoside 2-deoxyribosyltransferase [Symmachiella macrocystis]|uniref:Nucleoside 2-deoxyribosyltransferase n=1 Tax=Symmachiella macrocystis TaxID=2527985 RepID=A0A5C6ATJ3_9PLAN|nr:DUF1937 family protein [Symmachiella macrocystis]TWU03050.1 Nucleoside 2-deoxyribosyltransferase [Symmachiella macrocystis]
MIYLASPYSHPDAIIRERRFRAACRVAARLIRSGEVVFSPVAHGHAISLYGVPTDWSFWEAHDRRFLELCDEVVVLMLAGWLASVGVAAEIETAKEQNKPVRYLDAGSLANVGHGGISRSDRMGQIHQRGDGERAG